MQYTQDYDGTIVPAQLTYNVPPATSGGPVISWPSLVYPYVKSAGIFVCPSADDQLFRADSKKITFNGAPSNKMYTGITDPKQGTPPGSPTGNAGDGSTPSLSVVPRLSYGRNVIPVGTQANNTSWVAVNGGRVTNSGKSYSAFANLTDKQKSGWVAASTGADISEADVADTAGTIHFVDAMTGAVPAGTEFTDPRNNGNSIRGIQQDVRTDMYPDDTASKVAYRHNDGFVILYGDGHSGWKKWGSTTPCMWTIQDDTCN